MYLKLLIEVLLVTITAMSAPRQYMTLMQMDKQQRSNSSADESVSSLYRCFSSRATWQSYLSRLDPTQPSCSK